jgi:hypothetical protein
MNIVSMTRSLDMVSSKDILKISFLKKLQHLLNKCVGFLLIKSNSYLFIFSK